MLIEWLGIEANKVIKVFIANFQFFMLKCSEGVCICKKVDSWVGICIQKPYGSFLRFKIQNHLLAILSLLKYLVEKLPLRLKCCFTFQKAFSKTIISNLQVVGFNWKAHSSVLIQQCHGGLFRGKLSHGTNMIDLEVFCIVRFGLKNWFLSWKVLEGSKRNQMDKIKYL